MSIYTFNSLSMENSVCNHYRFNQYFLKKKKDVSGSELTAKENFLEIKIVNNQLESLSQCCPIGDNWGYLLSQAFY